MIATIKDKTRKITLSEFGEVKIKLANQKGKNHIKRKNALTIK